MKKIIILISTYIMFFYNALGQIEELIPRSPESESLIKAIDVPIGKYTGTYDINVPIGSVSEGRISVPVSLDYRGDSKRASEKSGPAGLGWNVSTFGTITRVVKGLRDEIPNIGFLDLRVNNPEMYIDIETKLQDENEQQNLELSYLNSCYDTEPDEFYFQIGDISGKFAFSYDTSEDIIVGSSNSVKIKDYSVNTADYHSTSLITALQNWELVDDNGFKYTFSAYDLSKMIQVQGALEGITSPCTEVDGEYNYINTWFLTKVEDLSNPNNHIDITYEDNFYNSGLTPFESASVLNPLEDIDCMQQYVLSNSGSLTSYDESYDEVINSSIVYGQRIKKIINSSNNQEIEFFYNTDRNDLNSPANGNVRRLDLIKVRANNNLLFSYTLDYFNNNNKLLLKEIQQVNGVEYIPPYEFTYYSPISNADHLNSTDHWGFPNGSTTSTNLPPYSFETTLGDLVEMGSNNTRTPNLNGSRSYMMKSVKYPTGVYKNFEYELNKAGYISTRRVLDHFLGPGGNPYPVPIDDEMRNYGSDIDILFFGDLFNTTPVVQNFKCGDCDNYSSQQTCYNLFEVVNDLNKKTKVTTRIRGRISPAEIEHEYYIEDKVFAFNYQKLLLLETGENQNQVSVSECGVPIPLEDVGNNIFDDYIAYELVDDSFLNPGIYGANIVVKGNGGNFLNGEATIKVSYENLDIPGYEFGDDLTCSPLTIDVGGVRVKNIKTYTEDNVLQNVKNYVYEECTGSSSGIIQSLPQYVDPFKRLIWGIDYIEIGGGTLILTDYNADNCEEWKIATSSKTIFGDTKGSHIGYRKVIEYDSGKDETIINYTTNPNGYQISNYTSFKEYPDIIMKIRPFGNGNSQSYKTGYLKNNSIFNSEGDLVMSTENFYEFNQKDFPCIKLSYGYISKELPNSIWGSSTSLFTSPNATVNNEWINAPIYLAIGANFNPHVYGYANLSKTISTTYSENGNQPITDIVEYQYDPVYNNVVSKKSWRNLNNATNFEQDVSEDYTYTSYKYAYDGFGGVSTDLINANMIGIPFQTLTQYNSTDETSNIIDGNKVEYWTPNSGGTIYIKPYTFYNIKGGNMVKTAQVQGWTNDGRCNVGQVKSFTTNETLDDNYTEYIWSNDLVTEVQNHSSLGVQTTHYDYNNLRQLERITDHNGQITEFVYDGLQRLDKVKSGKGTGQIALDGTVIAPAGTGFRKETDYNYHYMLDANGDVVDNAENSIETTVRFPQDATLEDQVSRVIFDGLGREVRSEKDKFDANANNTVVLNEKVYDDFGRLKSETNLGSGFVSYSYEDAPLNRLLEVNTSISITKTQYGHNAGGNIAVDGKTYPATSLSRVRTSVYDRNNMEESRADNYADFMGREIMNINFVEKNTGGLAGVTTKMAYNNLNQLTKIFPHLGEHYEYTYNQRGLLSSKTIPNKGTMNYWYDKLERQVASDDPAGNIFVTMYDDLGREVVTGLKSTSIGHDSNTYTNFILPTEERQNVTVYHKDINNNPIDWIKHTNTKNLSNGNWLPTFMDNYDDLGRLLKSTSRNHKGNNEINEMTYNDADLLTYSKLSHNDNTTTPNNIWGNNFVLEWENTFDDAFRPKEVKFKDLTSNNWQTISQLAYNDKNQVIQKKLHETNNGDWWQKVDYVYDNVGRLKKINEPLDLKCDQSTAELCDKIFNVTPTDSGEILEIFVTDIQYYDREGALASIPLAYPYAINNFTIDGFQAAVGNWLNSNGYVYNHIEVSLEDGQITFGQTNIDLSLLLQSNTPKQVVTSDCCPISNVDLYAQTLVYSGNQIERMDWGVSCGGLQRYNFEYDMMHRLTDATYSDKPLGSGWAESNFYDTRVIYDHIGNIRNLYRNGKVNGGAIRIDNLKYKYTDPNNTSRLMKVEDRSRPEGFETTATYSYDANGNMKGNSGKAMNVFSNHFNLPNRVVKGGAGAGTIDFTYLADMTKAQKITKQGGITTTKDYIGSIEYKNGQVEAIYHSEGRFTLDASGNQQYEYTLKDHLGNARVSFTDVDGDGGINQSDILQENHYYPFGMQMENNGIVTTETQNDYQYNGKELNEELGLNWYNYGFRMYDPAIARFTGVDPISDQYAFVSTYNYAENSPIKFIDLHGLQKAEVHPVFTEVPKAFNTLWENGDKIIAELWGKYKEANKVIWSKDLAEKANGSKTMFEGTDIEFTLEQGDIITALHTLIDQNRTGVNTEILDLLANGEYDKALKIYLTNRVKKRLNSKKKDNASPEVNAHKKKKKSTGSWKKNKKKHQERSDTNINDRKKNKNRGDKNRKYNPTPNPNKKGNKKS